MQDIAEKNCRGRISTDKGFYHLPKSEQVDVSMDNIDKHISMILLGDREPINADRLKNIVALLVRRSNRFRAAPFSMDPKVVRSFDAFFKADLATRRMYLNAAVRECLYLTRDRAFLQQAGYDAVNVLMHGCVLATLD